MILFNEDDEDLDGLNLEDEVEPIHAEAFFSVCRTGEIHQRLIFDYDDPEGYYYSVVNDDIKLNEEISKVVVNLQNYLDDEEVIINKIRVKPKVAFCDIIHRGNLDIPSITFVIRYMATFFEGKNIIDTTSDEEYAPYDFEVVWSFPEGTEITLVDTPLHYDIDGSILYLWAYEGESVGGHEIIEFILK